MCAIDDEEKTSCYLYVEEPAFKFTKRLPQQVEVDEYKNGELECEIEDEDAECEWFFEGKVLFLFLISLSNKVLIVLFILILLFKKKEN